jgi:hypothetical protein
MTTYDAYDKLIKLLDEADQLLAHFSGGYSGQFLSAEDFHKALHESVEKFKQGDTSQLNKIDSWFLPTSCWDDFVGIDGQGLAGEINCMLCKLIGKK